MCVQLCLLSKLYSKANHTHSHRERNTHICIQMLVKKIKSLRIQQKH